MRAALIASLAVPVPGGLAGQVASNTFAEAAGGLAVKPSYGVSDRRGVVLGARGGRYLAARLAIRLEGEFQSFGSGPLPVTLAPCPVGQFCPAEAGAYGGGAGPIRVVSVLVGLQYHEHAARRGFYLVAGLGPQVLASHPDRSPAVRLAAQAGVGLLVGGIALLETRYQPTFGARAEPRHVVLVTVGLRWIRPSRAPD